MPELVEGFHECAGQLNRLLEDDRIFSYTVHPTHFDVRLGRLGFLNLRVSPGGYELSVQDRYQLKDWPEHMRLEFDSPDVENAAGFGGDIEEGCRRVGAATVQSGIPYPEFYLAEDGPVAVTRVGERVSWSVQVDQDDPVFHGRLFVDGVERTAATVETFDELTEFMHQGFASLTVDDVVELFERSGEVLVVASEGAGFVVEPALGDPFTLALGDDSVWTVESAGSSWTLPCIGASLPLPKRAIDKFRDDEDREYWDSLTGEEQDELRRKWGEL